MSDDLGNGNNLRKVAESTAAVVFARFAMPILVALVGGTGSYILYDLVGQIKEIKDSIKPIWAQLGETNGRLGAIQIGVAAANAKQDEISSNTKSILNDHEIRMRVLEHPPH